MGMLTGEGEHSKQTQLFSGIGFDLLKHTHVRCVCHGKVFLTYDVFAPSLFTHIKWFTAWWF